MASTTAKVTPISTTAKSEGDVDGEGMMEQIGGKAESPDVDEHQSPVSNIGQVMSSVRTVLKELEDDIRRKYVQQMESSLSAMEKKFETLNDSLLQIRTFVGRVSDEAKDVRKEEFAMIQSQVQFQCGICMSKYKSVAFQCGHAFCKECVQKRQRGSESKTCPVCRQWIRGTLNLKI